MAMTLQCYTNSSQIIDDINQELKNVVKWLNCSKLALNVKKKPQSIIYQKIGADPPSNICLNAEPLRYVESINFLGVFFEPQLNFAKHIIKVRSNISRTLGILNRSKHFMTRKSRLLLYNALILPHLNYGRELWAGTTQNLLNPLRVLQKRAVRFIENAGYRFHTSHLYKTHNILKLEDLYQYHILILMYKAFHSKLPVSIQKRYCRPQSGRVTRQSTWNLKVLKFKIYAPQLQAHIIYGTIFQEILETPCL